MTLDTTELRRLAEAATPGPWSISGQRTVRALSLRTTIVHAFDYAATGRGERDARFIAAASPAAVLALLDRLERAEAAERERDRMRRGWLTTIQVENSCPATGGGCLAKRCGCVEEMKMLMDEDDARAALAAKESGHE